MALTPAEASELQSLSDALLKLRTGKLPSKIVFNGQETDFAKVDLGDLRARVDELTAQAARPLADFPRRRRGAVGFRL
jgi:hypothetical protein